MISYEDEVQVWYACSAVLQPEYEDQKLTYLRMQLIDSLESVHCIDHIAKHCIARHPEGGGCAVQCKVGHIGDKLIRTMLRMRFPLLGPYSSLNQAARLIGLCNLILVCIQFFAELHRIVSQDASVKLREGLSHA